MVLTEALWSGKANVPSGIWTIPVKMNNFFFQCERDLFLSMCHQVACCFSQEMVPYWRYTTGLCYWQVGYSKWHNPSNLVTVSPYYWTQAQIPFLPPWLLSLLACCAGRERLMREAADMNWITSTWILSASSMLDAFWTYDTKMSTLCDYPYRSIHIPILHLPPLCPSLNHSPSRLLTN